MICFNLLILYFLLSIAVLWWWPKLWPRLLAAFLGMIIGLLDLHSSEVQMSLLMLLVLGFFCGFAEPKRAWFTAGLLAMWIPIVTVAALLCGVIRGQPFGVPATGLAFVPALVGTYSGVFVRRFGRGTPPIPGQV